MLEDGTRTDIILGDVLVSPTWLDLIHSTGMRSHTLDT